MVADAMVRWGEPDIIVTYHEYGGAVVVGRIVTATHYADVYEAAAKANGYDLGHDLLSS